VVKKAIQDSVDGFELGLSSAGKVFLRVNQASSGNTFRVDSTSWYPTGSTWAHIAGTYDGTTLRIYVNGVEEASVAGPAAVALNDLPLTLGAEPGGSRGFSGRLDGVAMYARALSPAEVAVLATLP